LIPNPPTIKIMIVDRNKLDREGLAKLILDQPGLRVVAEAEDCADGCRLAALKRPDVILLDLDLVTENGLDALPCLLDSSRESRVLVLAHRADREAQRKATLLGAMGVIGMGEGIEVLTKAIEKVHDGEVWYDRAEMGLILREILQNNNFKRSDPVAVNIATLTAREREVIHLISDGLRNKEIGEKLFISETTVRHHLSSIFDKLEVSNRLELIIFAFSEGLASLPDPGQYRGSSHDSAK
jgi:two-component system, NarL family, nitrate/nitrite response regulator NarL